MKYKAFKYSLSWKPNKSRSSYCLAVGFVSAMIKAIVVTAKIVMPTQTCGSFKIGRAKQNNAQLTAFVITAITFVNFEPPLSMATRL